MIRQRQKRARDGRTTLAKQLDKDASATNQLPADQAIPLLLSVLREKHASIRTNLYSLAAWIGFLLLCAWAFIYQFHWSFLRSVFPTMVIQAAIQLVLALFQSPAKRYPGWQKGLEAFLFHAEKTSMELRLKPLVEITSWLLQRPRLTDPKIRERFIVLVIHDLTAADARQLKTLGQAALVALLTPRATDQHPTLATAALLALSCTPGAPVLALHRYTTHPNKQVRAAADEYYRAAR